jgi:predicted PurR-regulated permease PerM
MPQTFNNRLRQLFLLLIIVLLALLLLSHLAVFLPGFLGAITLYILMRNSYFRFTIKNKWNKTWVAIFFIISSMTLIAIPIFFCIELVSEKVAALAKNPEQLIEKAKTIGNKLEQVSGIRILSDENIRVFQNKAATIIPQILNSSAGILSNFAILFFLLYFLLKNGKDVEKFLDRTIPLKEENLNMLGNETVNMIRANAIGLPVLAIIQGIIASIGYAVFGVQESLLWGFITGVCSLIPVVGTAIIWIPLVAYFFAVGNNSSGVGLLIYALVLITHIDYVARLTILKKFMDIHPLITIFGVIVGIGLFGFWGVIFGPLLISYFIILVKIYVNEFGKPANE